MSEQAWKLFSMYTLVGGILDNFSDRYYTMASIGSMVFFPFASKDSVQVVSMYVEKARGADVQISRTILG